jgi:hypothetical protein
VLGPLCSRMPLDNGGFLLTGGGQPICRTGLRKRSRSRARFAGGICQVLINAAVIGKVEPKPKSNLADDRRRDPREVMLRAGRRGSTSFASFSLCSIRRNVLSGTRFCRCAGAFAFPSLAHFFAPGENM